PNGTCPQTIAGPSGFTPVLKSMLPRASLSNINRPFRHCDDTSHVEYVSGRLDYRPEKSQSDQAFAFWGRRLHCRAVEFWSWQQVPSLSPPSGGARGRKPTRRVRCASLSGSPLGGRATLLHG